MRAGCRMAPNSLSQANMHLLVPALQSSSTPASFPATLSCCIHCCMQKQLQNRTALHDRCRFDSSSMTHVGESRRVHPVCSLHVLERLLNVMSFTPFIDLLVSLLCPQTYKSMGSSRTQDATRASSGSFASTSQPNRLSSQQHSLAPVQGRSAPTAEADMADDRATPAAAAEAGAVPGSQSEASPWQALFALHEHSTAYRACLLQVLQGKDAQLICAAVGAVAAVVQSKAASAHVLSSAGRSLPSLCACP